MAEADAAAAEWQAAFRGRAPVHRDGRETRPLLRERTSRTAAVNFAAFNDRLESIPIDDHAAWADAARDVSGALSARARYDAANRNELKHAAATLGRSAQVQRTALPPGRRVRESPMGTALLFMQARRDDRPKIAGLILLQQMILTVLRMSPRRCSWAIRLADRWASGPSYEVGQDGLDHGVDKGGQVGGPVGSNLEGSGDLDSSDGWIRLHVPWWVRFRFAKVVLSD